MINKTYRQSLKGPIQPKLITLQPQPGKSIENGKETVHRDLRMPDECS
jgi:hypothetical protein